MATVELNKGNFEQVITGNDMVIVDFWGDRAGRSRAPSQTGCDPGAGCGRPTLKRGRWHPLRWPIPLRGSLVPRSGAPWCGPCRSFAPTYEAAAEKFPGVVFGKVNTEEEQELGGHFGIRSIPTLMVFRQQVILFSQPGRPRRAEQGPVAGGMRPRSGMRSPQSKARSLASPPLADPATRVPRPTLRGALPASGLEGVITQSLALDMDKVRADIAANAEKLS